MVKHIKNAADESQVNEFKKDEKVKSDNYEICLKHILNSDVGRVVLWKILEDCGIYRSSFTGSSETFFLEGRRDIGLKLLASIIKVDPDAYVRMLKEKGEK